MKVYLYPTMREWFAYLASRSDLEEVNFWRPGGVQPFTQLQPGDLFLFRTKAPSIAIGGGGIFTGFSIAPVSEAWKAFGVKNGASTFEGFLRLIATHKGLSDNPALAADKPIGCIMIAHPVFWPEENWIPVPQDLALNNPQGTGYDASSSTGAALVQAFEERQGAPAPGRVRELVRVPVEFQSSVVRRRLGQGAFMMQVNDVYETRCAVTGERTRPVLEAAHIKPVEEGGVHSIDNGLLLRVDIHRLFDKGYVTVTPRGEFRVSRSLKDDWQNGRIYYDLDRRSIRDPIRPEFRPASEFLQWHNDERFKQ